MIGDKRYLSPTHRLPLLGEHTDQVLSEWLWLNAQAVSEMKREGVICPATPG